MTGTSAGPKAGIAIEDIDDIGRLTAIEELQLQIWGDSPRTVVPTHILSLIATSGGIVIGAYDGGDLVGFAYGLLARKGARLYHASHQLGTRPDYQGAGIGAALKWAQRDRCRAQGLDLMTWTFDPLQARNASFNLHKLGVVSRTYKNNVYGELNDDLNRGLPSDRLLVEWFLVEEVARPRIAAPALPLLEDVAGRPVYHAEHLAARRPLRVATPSSILDVKRADPALALTWRLAVREALSAAFDHGYVAVDFVDGSFVLLHNPPLPRGL